MIDTTRLRTLLVAGTLLLGPHALCGQQGPPSDVRGRMQQVWDLSRPTTRVQATVRGARVLLAGTPLGSLDGDSLTLQLQPPPNGRAEQARVAWGDVEVVWVADKPARPSAGRMLKRLVIPAALGAGLGTLLRREHAGNAAGGGAAIGAVLALPWVLNAPTGEPVRWSEAWRRG